MVKGVTKETLDGISLEWFEKTSRSLRRESLLFKPNRRVHIPKANGKLRPLGIASPRDKIIQQAMTMVMETILEPSFLDSSHGFRPHRGCHTALRQVKSWTGVPWIIEGDIKSFFDMIDHHILANLIDKHIAEKRLFNLYWKFVKAGYVEFNDKKQTYIAPDMGVPQGGILSPLLSNVVLHELDRYMETRRLKFEADSNGQPPKVLNPEYYRISRLIQKCRKANARPELEAALKLRNRVSSKIANPLGTRITYVRYADDWLVGVWGPKSTAVSLKSDIADFLQSLKLTLSEEKTLITNTRRDKVKFLGTYIRRMTPIHGRLSHPSSAGHVRMTAPMDILTKRLREKGFWRPGPSGPRAKWIPNFVNWPIKDMILRFRTILSGLLNYYSFADNIGSLSYIYFLLHGSLRSTICRKLDMRIREFYATFGPKITIQIPTKAKGYVDLDFPRPSLKRTPMKFQGRLHLDKDPMGIKDWKVSTISALDQCCANCASTRDIEMHHLRHLKTMNAKLDSCTPPSPSPPPNSGGEGAGGGRKDDGLN